MTDRQTWHKNGLSIVEQNKRLEKNYILVHKKKLGKGCQQRREMMFPFFVQFFFSTFFLVKVLEIQKLQIHAATLANDFTKNTSKYTPTLFLQKCRESTVFNKVDFFVDYNFFAFYTMQQLIRRQNHKISDKQNDRNL